MDEELTSVSTDEPQVSTRTLKPWVAGVLSLLAPGAGQYYTGRLRPALYFALADLVGITLLAITLAPRSFAGLLLVIAVAMGIALAALIESVRFARSDPVVASGPHHTRGYIVGFVLACLIAGQLTVVLIGAVGMKAFRVPTGSMEDTLLAGDYIAVAVGCHREPANGAVTVFRYPLDPSLEYVKRCVAGPGQTLVIRNRDVYVDGQLVAYPQAKFTGTAFEPQVRERGIFAPVDSLWNRDHYGPLRIPDGCYFMMGDNRDNSADSRYFGFVRQEHIVGDVRYIYWSWDGRHVRPRWPRIGQSIQ